MSPRDTSPPGVDSLIAVGIIRKAHGVRGEASVESLTDSVERFSSLGDVFLVSPDEQTVQPARVLSARAHGERALVKLDVIDTPEKVRDFHNWTIEVREEDARVLAEDEYFIHDLVGMEVASPEGRTIGKVADAMETPGGLLLLIEKPEGGTFEVPFAADIFTSINREARRMTAAIPEGLDDLDAIPVVEDDVDDVDEVDRQNQSTSSTPSPSSTSSTLPSPALTVDIVTIFPKMFDAILEEGIVARAAKSNLLQVVRRDLRDYTTDKHRSTDDEAYGGGAGMVMLAEPVLRCVDAIREERGEPEPYVVMMSPQGRLFTQEVARELAGKTHLVLLCGRYEGFDERIREAVVDEELSIGDFVVTGGELPAMLVLDAVARMVEGVVGHRNSVEADSFYNALLDYPHYTRPAELRGMRVPEVLLSGHAEKIRQWRKEQSLRNTLRKRPDLLDKADLDEEAKRMLERIRRESE